LKVERRQPPTAGPFERFRGEAAMRSGFEEQPEDYGIDLASNTQPQVSLAPKRGSNQQSCDTHTSNQRLRKNGNWTNATLQQAMDVIH
jgi:hypothetical protein